jgi:C4-dicarboxylate transporter DctQ subunit
MLSRIMNGLEEGIISLLLVVMTLVVFVEVILRFGFNTGMVWSDEFVLHLSAWMVLLGASYGVKVGSHIGVDALVKALPARWQRIVTVVALLLCLVYCGLLIDGSWVYLRKIYRIGIEMEDIPFPRWLADSALVIGFALLAFRFCSLLYQVIIGKTTGFNFADEARDAMDTLVEHEEQKGAKQ